MHRHRDVFPILLLLSCTHGEDAMGTDPGPDKGPGQTLVVSTSDFASGALSLVDRQSRQVMKNIDVLDPQSVVRVYGGKVYVLDQTHGLVRVYDPAKGYKDPIEFPTGHASVPAAQANPHDIYVDAAMGRAFITLYGSYGSTRVTGQNALGIVDLGDPKAGITRVLPLEVSPSDTDNNPDADRLFFCGGRLYVTLQDLDRNNDSRPAGAARLAIVDPGRPEIIGYLQLRGHNPTAIARAGDGCGRVYIGHGDYQLGGAPSGKGGIERVDLERQSSSGLVFTDTQLGGNVSTLDVFAAGEERLLVDLLEKRGTSFEHSVHLLDPARGRRLERIFGPVSYVPAVRVFGEQVVVLAASSLPSQPPAGLYLGAVQPTPAPLAHVDVGLPPLSVDLY